MTQIQHMTAAVAIAACWGTVVVAWVVGAAYNASRGPRRRAPRDRRQVLLVVAIVAAAVALVRLVPEGVWSRLNLESWVVTVVGATLLVSSTAFALWARLTLGAMWSADVLVREGHELRTHGPYGVTRHPIYTGMLGMLLGTALLLGAGPALMILPVGLAFFAVRIRAEERLMLQSFPDDYPRYRRRVPRLLPLPRRSQGEPPRAGRQTARR